MRQAQMLSLFIGGQEIQTTHEHPFYVKEKGWIPAKELIEGDLLIGINGEWTSVSSIAGTSKIETVYNFRVAEHHTYFVGGDDWGFSIWVHNRYSVKPIPGDFVNGNQVYGLWDDTLNNGAGGWANYPNTGQPIRSTSPGKLGDVADNANAKANANQDVTNPGTNPFPRTGATTPGGRAITNHAAEDSLIRHGFAPPFGEIDDIIAKAQWTRRQADGATVYIHKVPGRGRKYHIVIEGNAGIVTAMKNLTPHELRNLARNYGFQLPW